MVTLRNFVELFEFSRWPRKVKMKPIPEVGEVFYEDCTWKLVDRDAISRDISRKGEQSIFYAFRNHLLNCQNESLLLCYNPIFPARKVRVCISDSDAERTQRELFALKREYYERPVFAQISQPRKWISFGSEQQVEQEKYKFREDNIMIEWIGPLMSRRENVIFTDRDPADLVNGYVYVSPSSLDDFDVKPLLQRDASVQACVLKRNTHAQTEIRGINELFECTSSRDSEQIVAAREQSEIIKSQIIPEADNSTNIHERTKEDLSSGAKSFVNIECRRRSISSVDWHRNKIGFVAVAYRLSSDGGNDKSDNLIDGEIDLIPKKFRTMQEHELRIDGRLFDASTRRNRLENDSVKAEEDMYDGGNETDGEDVDSSSNAGGGEPTKVGLHRGNSFSPVTPSLGRRATRVSKEVTESEEAHWSARTLELCQQHPYECRKTVNSFDILSPPTSSQEDSNSHSSDSEGSAPSQSDLADNVVVQEDPSSDESELLEDNLQITDANSNVYLWHCEDVLNPRMKLYSAQDITVVKFYPYNDDFVIGGNVKGQIVVWNLQGEWERAKDANNIDDMGEYWTTWEMNDVKIPVYRPVAVSERNISHSVQITSLEWPDPSLRSALGEKHSKLEGNEFTKQIISSSTDGWFKVWSLNSKFDKMQTTLSVELIYTIIARPDQFIRNEKLWSLARALPLFAGSLSCISVDDEFYEYACEDQWGRWHDGEIVSLSRNHHFTNIVLVIGGTIASLWNLKFKGGPLWWQQYDEGVSLTQGCFAPFHPGLFYVGRSDGKVDLWHIGKQMHEPVVQIMVSGYSITNLSVVTFANSKHHISVSDSKSNFLLLECSYDDPPWNKDSLEKVTKFFKEAAHSQKQSNWWNRTFEKNSLSQN